MHPQISRCYDIALGGAWRHPFFLIPLGAVEWREADPVKVPTMMVSSRIAGRGRDARPEIQLHINTEWVAGIPDDQIFGCLAHEIMHSLMRHHERQENKNAETWGQAADMAINSALTQSGIKLPDGALYPPRDHENDAAEELYTLLDTGEIPRPKNSNPDKVGAGCLPSDDPSAGSGKPDEPGEGSGEASEAGEPGECENPDRVWSEMVAQAANASRGHGSAASLARIFTPRPSKTKWSRLLRSATSRAISRGGRDQQSYARVNRRSTEIILPGWQSNRPQVAIMIDSSGSVDDAMLAAALTAAVECARISGARIFLALHASECYFADWIRADTSVAHLSSLCTDRGGTDCGGAFAALAAARGKFDQCVYLTDGEVGKYPDRPENVRNLIVGILGDRPGQYRAPIPDTWREVAVELD